jgi:hypothetical protein
MITFYPTVSKGEFGKYCNVPCALLPASSWAGYEMKERGLDKNGLVRAIPEPNPAIVSKIIKRAADSGGFVAMKKWGGSYIYTPGQYVQWLRSWSPDWAATMDFCCESPLTGGHAEVVVKRQLLTTEIAYHFWNDYREESWAWVPTIQGWEVEDYQRHVRTMKPLIEEMQAYYLQRDGLDNEFRVGIGTLCARASAEMIRKVVMMVASEIPGIPLHLWGVKLSVLQSPVSIPQQVASVDSGAWNGMWGKNREIWKRSPYSQREWCFRVALPDYEAKVQMALSCPKQLSLNMEEAS